MAETPLVLVIDDEPLVRFSLAAFLEDCGFQCLQAGDGREGLEAFARTRPALVLTDLRMPHMDGFQFVERLMALDPAMPVVAITGTGDASAGEEVVRLGARTCLFKPFHDLTVLAETLRSILKELGDDGCRTNPDHR
jgi:CheY-like chemotaxis protein